jgi:5-methylcytosine-specific restriction protein A
MFNFYTRSSQWTSIRKQHLKENNSCSGCGRKDKLEVHHIEPYHVNPNRELDPSNLVTLCKSCHFAIGHLMDWSSWNIDVINDCKVYLNKVKNRPYQIKVQSNENSIIHSCFNSIVKFLWWD